MSVGKLDWKDCAFCERYDKEKNECKKGVWDDDVYLEVHGNSIECICFEDKEED